MKNIAFTICIVAALLSTPAFANMSHTVLVDRVTISNCLAVVDLGTWCGRGIEERGRIITTPVTILPLRGSQQVYLHYVIKPNAEGLIQYFVNHEYAIGGNMDLWFSTNASATQAPKWTENSIISSIGIPTDYFGNTPWLRAPDSSPYGWLEMTQVIARLVWTESSAGWVRELAYEKVAWLSTSTWAQADANCAAKPCITNLYFSSPTFLTIHNWGQSFIHIGVFVSTIPTSALYSAYSKDVDIYIKPTGPDTYFDSNVFDANGHAIGSPDIYSRLLTLNNPSSVSVRLPDLSSPCSSTPNWPAAGNGQSLGYRIQEYLRCIIKWNVTGGLQYL